jgi:hypothetical protein
MAIIYKIVCEVRWMHEYYLTTDKGATIFDLPTQADREIFLFQQFIKDTPTINKNLEFVIPDAQQLLYNNLNLKIIPSYSGCKLAIKCNKKIIADGSTVYQPVAPLSAGTVIPIMIREKSSIAGFSNFSVAAPFRAGWYFSNRDFPGAKTFPFLSGPVPAFEPAAVYEQGELALFGPNDVRTFLNNGGVDPWLKLNGTGYINEADRMLVPLGFKYAFTAAENITDAVFLLKDAAGTEVKRITTTSSTPLNGVMLNFRTTNNTIVTVPGKIPDANSIYTLEITGTNGYQKKFKLLFADDAANVTDYAGYINLGVQTTNTLFDLIDSNGFLKTRILPDSTKQPPPVFELWMKSRLAYWKYRNNRQRKIKLTIDTQEVLSDTSGVLVTQQPLFLTYTPVLLKKPDNSFLYLPNPMPGDLVRREGTKFMQEIVVPESKMFPLV